MLSKKKSFLVWLIAGIFLRGNGTAQYHIIHNELREIDNSAGTLQLSLAREWGGEGETDEYKFFNAPTDLAVDKDGNIYILEGTNIRVFDKSGKFIRRIGGPGQGPGDLLGAYILEIDSKGNLVINDSGNQRIQILNSEGQYQGSIPLTIDPRSPLLVTKNDEILMYNGRHSNDPVSFWQFFDYQGRLLRERGKRERHPTERAARFYSAFAIAEDQNGNVYSAGMYRPLIRKYSPGGDMRIEISYELPFEVPEIKPFRRAEGEFIAHERVCWAMDVDDRGRIYVLSPTRLMNLEERKIGYVIYNGSETIKLKANVDPAVSDLYQILVFSPSGKILAATRLNTHATKIKIFKDRLFLIDRDINMRILEYRIQFIE
jgi:hypothetical protein